MTTPAQQARLDRLYPSMAAAKPAPPAMTTPAQQARLDRLYPSMAAAKPAPPMTAEEHAVHGDDSRLHPGGARQLGNHGPPNQPAPVADAVPAADAAPEAPPTTRAEAEARLMARRFPSMVAPPTITAPGAEHLEPTALKAFSAVATLNGVTTEQVNKIVSWFAAHESEQQARYIATEDQRLEEQASRLNVMWDRDLRQEVGDVKASVYLKDAEAILKRYDTDGSALQHLKIAGVAKAPAVVKLLATLNREIERLEAINRARAQEGR